MLTDLERRERISALRAANDLLPQQSRLLAAFETVQQEFVARLARSLFGGGRAGTSKDIAAILIKPVSDHCNLRCNYCYEGEIGIREIGRMSDSLLYNVI